jgi:hypothetical protein
MSHGLRNTLILLFALLLITGGGFAWMHYFQKAEIERLEELVAELEREADESMQTAEMVPLLRQQHEAAQEFIEGFDKTIFRNNNPDEVFRFLSILNEMSGIDFNYTFRDSSSTSDYGVVRSEINGSGTYRGLMTFINAIEHSEPVQKIDDITITPVGQEGGYQRVNFSFHLNSHYDNQQRFHAAATPGVATSSGRSGHNPFYPLIRSVEPNTDDLVDVEDSRLVGVSSSSVFLIDQNGTMVTLSPGDRVYLGRLESINIGEGHASFRLNRGGLIDVITLEVQR